MAATGTVDLLVDLNARDGRTIVIVLHDLSHAACYGHHLVARRDGRLVAATPGCRSEMSRLSG